MAGFTVSLLTCLAQHLEDAGVGNWNPEGAYPTAATTTPAVIYLKTIPGAGPDRALALTYYDVDSNAGLGDDIAGVQVRTRGTKDPTVVDELTDAVFDALHGVRMLTLGPERLPVALIWRTSHADLGQDANGRWESSSNYYAHVNRPTAHRPD